MKKAILAAATLAGAFLAPSALAEPLIWGIQAEQFEYRVNDDASVLAWDSDAIIGSDELKFVWRSEGEYELRERALETLENQARLQFPISDFFDGIAGVRVDTPDGPDRVYGVLGLHGLTQQWFEIDADLFLSDHPSFRFEVEYEALITNRIILTPSVEIDLPFTDDEALGIGAYGPKLEAGARLSYDLIDRAVAPYVGLHYERVFGRTADLARADGEDAGELFFVAGAKLMF